MIDPADEARYDDAERVVLDPASTSDQLVAAVASVDALGDPMASQAIRLTMEGRVPSHRPGSAQPTNSAKAGALREFLAETTSVRMPEPTEAETT